MYIRHASPCSHTALDPRVPAYYVTGHVGFSSIWADIDCTEREAPRGVVLRPFRTPSTFFGDRMVGI